MTSWLPEVANSTLAVPVLAPRARLTQQGIKLHCASIGQLVPAGSQRRPFESPSDSSDVVVMIPHGIS